MPDAQLPFSTSAIEESVTGLASAAEKSTLRWLNRKRQEFTAIERVRLDGAHLIYKHEITAGWHSLQRRQNSSPTASSRAFKRVRLSSIACCCAAVGLTLGKKRVTVS